MAIAGDDVVVLWTRVSASSERNHLMLSFSNYANTRYLRIVLIRLQRYMIVGFQIVSVLVKLRDELFTPHFMNQIIITACSMLEVKYLLCTSMREEQNCSVKLLWLFVLLYWNRALWIHDNDTISFALCIILYFSPSCHISFPKTLRKKKISGNDICSVQNRYTRYSIISLICVHGCTTLHSNISGFINTMAYNKVQAKSRKPIYR